MNTINFNLSQPRPSFKGYDARELNGLLVTDRECADTFKKMNLPIDIYSPQDVLPKGNNNIKNLTRKNEFLWAQDYITFINHEVRGVLFDKTRNEELLTKGLEQVSNGIGNKLKFKSLGMNHWIRGGNFFICNVNGKSKMILNENKLKAFDEKSQENIKDLIKLYAHVDEIVLIPTIDYHVDLFLRPLDDGKILVADPKLTRKGMEDGIEKINNYIEQNELSDKEKKELLEIQKQLDLYIKKLDVTTEFYKDLDKLPAIREKLQEAGFTTIDVPATYPYYDFMRFEDEVKKQKEHFYQQIEREIRDRNILFPSEEDKKMFIDLHAMQEFSKPMFGIKPTIKYENNFINAITFKKNGKLYYITGGSLLDNSLGITPDIAKKIGFSTRKMFTDSIKDYVDERNIRFTNSALTKRLYDLVGGVHCTASEIV